MSRSYKVIEEGSLRLTEHPEQALSTSFLAYTDVPEHFGQTLFSQPPLCRHAGTDNWGTVENWEDDAVCVFGVSFAKDDGRYVLDRGSQYRL